VGLGVAQAAGGDREAAINSFDLAAAVEPNSTLLLAEMARLQLKAAAADAFCKNFEAGKDVPVAEIDLDNDDLLNKQVDRHAEQVAQHPGHADLRYRYGVLLRAEGRLGEAVEQFCKAVEINPAYVQAIIKLGITQQELGMLEEAIATFKRALEIKPQYVDLHYRLGLLHTDRREFEQAAIEMEAAAAGSPDNEQIRANLALSLQNMGLLDRAAATWRSLWKIHQSASHKS
jgi:tetratricopeptide (TPR) repeat protein